MTDIPTVVSDDGTVQTVEDLVAGDSPDPAEVVADIDSIQYYTRLLDAAIEEAHNIIKKNGRFKNADRGRWAFKKRYVDCDDRTSREIVEDPDSPYRDIKSKNKANQFDQDAKRYREQIQKVVATLSAESRGYLSNLLAVIGSGIGGGSRPEAREATTMTPAQAAKEVREREAREREQWAQAHPVRVYTREEIEAFRLSHGKVET